MFQNKRAISIQGLLWLIESNWKALSFHLHTAAYPLIEHSKSVRESKIMLTTKSLIKRLERNAKCLLLVNTHARKDNK